MKMRSQQSMSDASKVSRPRGLSFDEFKAYRSRCLEPEKYLDEDHYFRNFDLKSHNANAEQLEKVAEAKRIEASTP